MTEIIEAFWRSEARLVVQVLFFLVIIGGLIHVHLRLGVVIQQLTDERVESISKVMHVADDLATRVAKIAERIHLDTEVITHELVGKADDAATVRDQIDAIKQSTDTLVNGNTKVP